MPNIYGARKIRSKHYNSQTVLGDMDTVILASILYIVLLRWAKLNLPSFFMLKKKKI